MKSLIKQLPFTAYSSRVHKIGVWRICISFCNFTTFEKIEKQNLTLVQGSDLKYHNLTVMEAGGLVCHKNLV